MGDGYAYTHRLNCYAYGQFRVRRSILNKYAAGSECFRLPKIQQYTFPYRPVCWLYLRPRISKGAKSYIVQYQSKDSIVFDAKSNIFSLRGPSILEYDNMKLEANHIALNLTEQLVTAQGAKEGNSMEAGHPVFTYQETQEGKYGKQGSTSTRTFFMNKICYNFQTKQALVHQLTTKQDESLVQGEKIKKIDDSTFYVKNLAYTTCNLKKPHFYIWMKQAKIVANQQVTSGPCCLYFDDVPTPIGAFFGALFLEGKRRHGIIPPEIGEEHNNGFYLRNGGYYINIHDYIDLSLLGSIYSTGATEIKNTLRYKKRYWFNGNISYDKNSGNSSSGWSMKWVHKTLSRTSRSLAANFDLQSSQYKTLHDLADSSDLNKNKNRSSSAMLSYTDKLPILPYSLSLQAKYNKNLETQFAHWILPTATLSASWASFFPGIAGRYLQNCKVQHTIAFENHAQNLKSDPNQQGKKIMARLYSESSVDETKKNTTFSNTYKWNAYTHRGILHTIPISLEGKLFTYFSFTPKFTWSEAWYFEKLFFKDDYEIIGPSYVSGFHRVYSYDVSANLSTTLYCTRYFSATSLIQGLRIKTEPSCTFTYTPDFSKDKYGYFQKVGPKKDKKYLFEGFRPQKSLKPRQSAVLSIALRNNAELKVKKPDDGETQKGTNNSYTLSLLKHFDVETQYDFNAKDFCLGDLSFTMASDAQVLNVVTLSFDCSAAFDPYLLDKPKQNGTNVEEQRINVLAWHKGKYLGRIKQAAFKLDVGIDPSHYQKKEKNQSISDEINLAHPLEQRDHKIDFNASWHMNIEFSWHYNRLYTYQQGEKNYTTIKYLKFNGGMNLAKKWKLTLRTSYDVDKNKLTPDSTEIVVQRDLHCWQLSYTWYPMGESSKYDFSLGAKANVLKLLRLPRKRSYNKIG